MLGMTMNLFYKEENSAVLNLEQTIFENLVEISQAPPIFSSNFIAPCSIVSNTGTYNYDEINQKFLIILPISTNNPNPGFIGSKIVLDFRKEGESGPFNNIIGNEIVQFLSGEHEILDNIDH